VSILAACTATIVALCANDSWGGRTSDIVPAVTYCKANVSAVTAVLHLFSHAPCTRNIYAKANLASGGQALSCGSTSSRNHYDNGPTQVSVTKTCDMVAETGYGARGEHWDTDSEGAHHVSNSQSSLSCPPASQCTPQECPEGEVWDPWWCECQPGTPLILDIRGNGYALTDASDGVVFDLNGDGVARRVSWTQAGSDDGCLVYDRNGNDTVDSGAELFGAATPGVIGNASNGFEALLALEATSPGSIVDGVIDSEDWIFGELQIWRDTNHNGRSEAGELTDLATAGLVSLDTNYREARRQDPSGNEFRLRALSWWQHSAAISRALECPGITTTCGCVSMALSLNRRVGT
jgi:hypothetical protein